jgi:hypothetical protein
LGENDRVIMFDGSAKKAVDVVIGDRLLGPDGLARKVVRLFSGTEEMYEIIPNYNGKRWSCTGDHRIVLTCNDKKSKNYGKQVILKMRDYLGRSKYFKHTHKMTKSEMVFPAKESLKDRRQGDIANKFSGQHYSFQVKELGPQRYAGFEVEGPDSLYLLEDGTVTHNSRLLLNTMRAYPNLCKVWMAPGVDLLQQTYEMLRQELPAADIGRKYGRYDKLGKDLTLTSLDSVCTFTDGECESVQLLAIDEVHSAVAPARALQLNRFRNAHRLGFTATDSGRFDKADLLIEGLIGPKLTEVSFAQAVDQGILCPIRVYMLEVEIAYFQNVHSRHKAYKLYHNFNEDIVAHLNELLRHRIPKGWQKLIFIANEEQAEFLHDNLEGKPPIAMAKRFKSKKIELANGEKVTERELFNRKMASGETECVLASGIYSQGVTFSDLRVMINMSDTSGKISSVQRPGRLAQVREGKKRGYLVDILFKDVTKPEILKQVPKKQREWLCLPRDSATRKRTYEQTGYEVRVVKDPKEMVFD